MNPLKKPLRVFRDLIDALYAQLTRQPKCRPYSLVILTGSEPGQAGAVVTTFREQLQRDPRTLARIAHIEAPTGDPRTGGPDAQDDGDGYRGIVALLNQLKRDLSLSGRGQGWRKQGFPRFDTCRTAISARRSTEREFSEALYNGLAERHEFFDALANGANSIPGMLALAPVQLVLTNQVRQSLYKFWLRHAPSLRWVPRLNRASEDFVTYVRSSDLDDEELRIRILVEAFLRDLEWQLRSSVYSVGRRRRRPAVLLMSQPPAHPAETTFIEKYAEIASEENSAKSGRRTPVQIVAVWDSPQDLPNDSTEHLPEVVKNDMESVKAGDGARENAARVRTPRPGRRAGSPVALHVHVSFGESSGRGLPHAPSGLRKHRHDYLPPAASMLITMAVIAAVVWVIPHFPGGVGACSDTWATSATHERVGITDGTCPLSDDDKVLDVEGKIADQNRQVQAMVDKDQYHRPYQTVVLFSPFTVSSADVGQNSLDEARGVQLAQADVLQQAKDDPREIPVKVLLANSGDRIAAAPQVAKHIVARVDSDRISAVLGISQSRAEAHQAIQILSDHTKVPIIGTVTTGDRLLDSSPRYYEIVPRNIREAQTVAQFLDHQPVMVGPQGQEALAKDAVVVEDPRDEYSQNLAQDFRDSFAASGGHHVTTFDYGPPGVGQPGHDRTAPGDTPESTADQLVHDICKSIGNDPDMIFYASRAQELPGVLDKIDRETACHGRQLSFMGTDEDTRFIADGSLKPSKYQAVHFYNASFSNLTDPATPVARQFIADYRRTYHTAPGDSGAGDADDAFVAAWQAVNQAYQQDPAIPPDTVTAKMADGKVSFTGATGLIAFNGAHDITRVPADKPVFVMIERPSGPEPLLRCGQYAEGQVWSTWGTGNQEFPCPHDPAPPS